MVLGVIPSLLRAFACGGLLLAAVLVLEVGLARYVAPTLIPSGDSAPPLSAFPTLAVQVSASLLGFYLASVSIVLGASYLRVSAGVRALVFGNVRTKLYLESIGMAIGTGLTLILLQSLGVVFGYMTVTTYALLVVFSGWAFVRLAFGAFNLFNPIVLGEEPLKDLYRTINRLDSNGLLGDEAVLQATARKANHALRILAELIDLARNRGSADRDRLAAMVELLLGQVRFYAQRKYLLAPTSAWFMSEPAYPKWIEANHSAVSLALQTSTPLEARMEPVTDWFERRSAELAAAALEVCVAADDRDAALQITRAVAGTTHTLARSYHVDEAIVFSGIVRDRCWAIRSGNAAAVAIAAEPPLILSSLLLGWSEAIASWAEEIRTVVATTEWDRVSTKVVRIHGSARVWTAAQRLLREVRAEHEIEGRRVTPDWYLRFALADECILSLREFARQLPELLNDFTGPGLAQTSSVAKALAGGQALQALSKAELVRDTIPQAVKELESLWPGHDRQPAEEFEGLAECVRTCQSLILERLAEAVTELQPEQSQSAPDLFGQTLFTLVHHTEDAIASGDVDLIRRVFPQVLSAMLVLDEYVRSTYVPPTYQINSANLDPITDLLELSGLAIIYEAIRDDQSADSVRQAWVTWILSTGEPQGTAKKVLDMLDLIDGVFWWGISSRSIARTEWEMRLAKRIVEAGYARPEHFLFGDQPVWNAPPLIKMLGVSARMPTIDIHPRAVFAAEVIAPLSGETEEVQQERPGLRRYFQGRDFYSTSDTPEEHSNNPNEDQEGITDD